MSHRKPPYFNPQQWKAFNEITLIVGPCGSGKTQLLQDWMFHMRDELSTSIVNVYGVDKNEYACIPPCFIGTRSATEEDLHKFAQFVSTYSEKCLLILENYSSSLLESKPLQLQL